jgi:hypothetical protein
MPTAFVFPGQGSQAVGMGKALFERAPAARAVFEAVDDALVRGVFGEAGARLVIEEHLEGPERSVFGVCVVLARTNRRASNGDGLIPVPSFLRPWDGRVIAVHSDREVSFDFVAAGVAEVDLVPDLAAEPRAGNCKGLSCARDPGPL